MPAITQLVPGWMMAICTVWLCWATLAPVVADAARVSPPLQHICPMPYARHAVKCPPPHTVTTARVKCLSVTEIDICSL